MLIIDAGVSTGWFIPTIAAGKPRATFAGAQGSVDVPAVRAEAGIRVTLPGEISAGWAEQDGYAVLRVGAEEIARMPVRVVRTTAERAALRDAAIAAYQANQVFLDGFDPANAAAAIAQVRHLTAVQQSLIVLVADLIDLI